MQHLIALNFNKTIFPFVKSITSTARGSAIVERLRDALCQLCQLLHKSTKNRRVFGASLNPNRRNVHVVSAGRKKQLECGQMPNMMVALPNIGGALCSTPQSLADAHY